MALKKLSQVSNMINAPGRPNNSDAAISLFGRDRLRDFLPLTTRLTPRVISTRTTLINVRARFVRS
jgi:hypothetical protein